MPHLSTRALFYYIFFFIRFKNFSFHVKVFYLYFRTTTTFKLKYRVRVCEIWISECITDVTELTRSTQLSFVMGWPLCNFVATFKTLDLKQQWLAKLTE